MIQSDVYKGLYSSFLIFCHCCDLQEFYLISSSFHSSNMWNLYNNIIIHYFIFNSPGYINNQFLNWFLMTSSQLAC